MLDHPCRPQPDAPPPSSAEAEAFRRAIAAAFRRLDAEEALRRSQRALAVGAGLALIGVALYATLAATAPPGAAIAGLAAWALVLIGPGVLVWGVGAAGFLAAALAAE